MKAGRLKISDTYISGGGVTYVFHSYISEKQQYFIENILRLAKGLTHRFLVRFSEIQLQAYLDRLEAVK